MNFKETVIANEKFIKELENYTNDEIIIMMNFVDPSVAFAIGYVMGWRSTEALYER